jgi:hypothetical protein
MPPAGFACVDLEKHFSVITLVAAEPAHVSCEETATDAQKTAI